MSKHRELPDFVLCILFSFIDNPCTLKQLEHMYDFKAYNKNNYKIFKKQIICDSIKDISCDYRSHRCDNCNIAIKLLIYNQPNKKIRWCDLSKIFRWPPVYIHMNLDKKKMVRNCTLCGVTRYICSDCKNVFKKDPLYSCNNCAYEMNSLEEDYKLWYATNRW